MEKLFHTTSFLVDSDDDGSKTITVQWDDTQNDDPHLTTFAVYLAHKAYTLVDLNEQLQALQHTVTLQGHQILNAQHDVNSYNQQLGANTGYVERSKPTIQKVQTDHTSLQTTITAMGLTVNTQVTQLKDLTAKFNIYQTRTDTTLHNTHQNVLSLNNRFDQLSDKVDDIPNNEPDFFTRLTQSLSTLSSTLSIANTAKNIATDNTSKLTDLVSTIRDVTTIAKNAMSVVRDLTSTVDTLQNTIKSIKDNWQPKVDTEITDIQTQLNTFNKEWQPKIVAQIQTLHDKIIQIDGPEMTLLYNGRPLAEEYYIVSDKDVS
jgi:chromosome segregation ATPase